MNEKDIVIKLIRHKLKWSVGTRRLFKKSYNTTYTRATQDQIYEFGINRLYPMLDERDEVISRDQWDLDGLVGETEKQLFHPHYEILKDYIFKHHQRKHDILVIFECSNSKPYKNNALLKYYTKRYSDIADFACISNPGIIPLEYSNHYPYRYDEWNHFKETQEIEDKYVEVNTKRFKEYIDHFGYKEIIVLMQHHKPRRLFDELPPDPHIHIIIDKQFEEELLDKYESQYKTRGFIYTRMLKLKEVYQRFDKIIKEVERNLHK